MLVPIGTLTEILRDYILDFFSRATKNWRDIIHKLDTQYHYFKREILISQQSYGKFSDRKKLNSNFNTKN